MSVVGMERGIVCRSELGVVLKNLVELTAIVFACERTKGAACQLAVEYRVDVVVGREDIVRNRQASLFFRRIWLDVVIRLMFYGCSSSAVGEAVHESQKSLICLVCHVFHLKSN